MSDSMIPQIPKTAAEGIVKYLGNETAAFLQQAEARLKKYTKLWQLSRLSFMPTDTVNLLFECESAMHGPCVLKLCIPGPVAMTEINFLLTYNGHGYVKMWEHDFTDNIMLLERVTPGHQMWAVTCYKERARLMAMLIKNLPFIECKQGDYPSYKDLLVGVNKNIIAMDGTKEAQFYLNEALRIYHELKQKYQRTCLLHGDMHPENLLQNSQDGYTIIDPQGRADDPVMETARFLMNEVTGDAEKIHEIASIIEPIIGIPKADILKSMYIDAAFMCLSTFEEYFTTQEAFESAKIEALETCRFVYGLLINGD